MTGSPSSKPESFQPQRRYRQQREQAPRTRPMPRERAFDHETQHDRRANNRPTRSCPPLAARRDTGYMVFIAANNPPTDMAMPRMNASEFERKRRHGLLGVIVHLGFSPQRRAVYRLDAFEDCHAAAFHADGAGCWNTDRVKIERASSASIQASCRTRLPCASKCPDTRSTGPLPP